MKLSAIENTCAFLTMTSQNVCCDKAYTSVMQPNEMGYTVTVIVLHNYHSNGLTHL